MKYNCIKIGDILRCNSCTSPCIVRVRVESGKFNWTVVVLKKKDNPKFTEIKHSCIACPEELTSLSPEEMLEI